MSSFRLAQPRGRADGKPPRADIQDKYISSLKEQNRLMELEIEYLKKAQVQAARQSTEQPPGGSTAAAGSTYAAPDFPAPARSETPKGVMPARSVSPAGGGAGIDLQAQMQLPPGSSIDAMLAQIKQKAAQERQQMEAEHAQTEEKMGQLKVELAQLQRHADQLDTDKQAVHATYLAQLEKWETKTKTALVENQKLKKENGKLNLRLDVYKGKNEALEQEKAQVLKEEGGLGKQIVRLESWLQEERTKSASMTEQLKVAKREKREWATQAEDLRVS
jgi:hypothetical protein